MRNTRFLAAILATATLLASVPAFAWKIEIGEHTNLNIDYLLQVQAQFQEDAAPNKNDYSKDFFIRRSRILLFGDLWKGISFFMETEQANFGKGGDWSASFFIQDAFLTLKAHDAFMVDVGMILLPFSRPSIQGAIGLNAMDYHTGVIRFLDGSHKVWRDVGVQLRGYAAGKTFQYRLGVFNGAQNQGLMKDAKGAVMPNADGKAALASNPEDWPRFTGMVRYAILGKEPDFFPKGIYFGTEPLLSVGVGFDYQHDAVMDQDAKLDGAKKVTTPGKLRDYWATSADVFLDIPLGAKKDHEIVVQCAFLWYDHGRELKWAKDGTFSLVTSKNSGLGFMTELGYRWTFIEPVLSIDYFNNASSAENMASQVNKPGAQDLLSVRGGLNFWIRKHGANIKMEFGGEKKGDLSKADWIKTFTAQGQLFF